MILISSKATEKNTVVLEIKVDGEEFATTLENAFKKGVKNITLPGFRKGKAPRNVIKKMYGKNVFVDDAVNDSYSKAYSDAIDEAKIDPVDVANIEIKEADTNGYTFTATVTVKPEVEIKDYKGIKAEKTNQTVSAEMIDKEIERMADRNSRLVEVTDRAAAIGDSVIIDYSGVADGVKFDGGTAQNQTLSLGSGQFIPGFEEQVAGHNIGDEFDVTVTFPEQYQSQELAGKDAIFAVKLHEIKAKELPVIDDEFAKDVSEFDTLDQLKKDISEKLQKQFDDAAKNAVESQLFDAISGNLVADIPECMINHAIDDQIKELEYRLQSQGMNLEMYMQYTSTTMDMLKQTYREAAEKRVKVRLAFEKIAQLESIEVTDEDINAEVEKMALQYNMEADKVREVVPEEEIKKDLTINKAIDFVKENAIITEKAPEKEKAPAKKSSAKKSDDDADENSKKAPVKKQAKKAE